MEKQYRNMWDKSSTDKSSTALSQIDSIDMKAEDPLFAHASDGWSLGQMIAPPQTQDTHSLVDMPKHPTPRQDSYMFSPC